MSDIEEPVEEIKEEKVDKIQQHLEEEYIKHKKKITPEYREILIKRLEKAREVKKAGKKVGIKLERKKKTATDEKKNYCEICSKSYASPAGLKRHVEKFHNKKKMSTLVNEEEEKQSKKIKQNKQPISKQVKQVKIKEQKEEIHVEEIENKVLEPPPKQEIPIKPAPPPPPPTQPAPALKRPQPQLPREMKYTVKQFQLMQSQARNTVKIRQEQAKKASKQDHILASIALMKAGGLR